MLAVKHNLSHWFTGVMAVWEETEWSIRPDAAVTAQGRRAPVSRGVPAAYIHATRIVLPGTGCKRP